MMFRHRAGYAVRLARDEADRAAAQRLRHRVFVGELGARPPSPDGRERDRFDAGMDQVLVFDRLSGEPAAACRIGEGPDFASAEGFDLGPLLHSGLRLLELGRACVDSAHRGGPALLMLWHGLAAETARRGTGLIFGAASFHTLDAARIAPALACLFRDHAAPADLAVTARPGAEVVEVSTLSGPKGEADLPPLIRAYLRLGGKVGRQAVFDRSFGTIDVLMTLKARDFKALPGVPAP